MLIIDFYGFFERSNGNYQNLVKLLQDNSKTTTLRDIKKSFVHNLITISDGYLCDEFRSHILCLPISLCVRKTFSLKLDQSGNILIRQEVHIIYVRYGWESKT
jgi:hypothetical protein